MSRDEKKSFWIEILKKNIQDFTWLDYQALFGKWARGVERSGESRPRAKKEVGCVGGFVLIAQPAFLPSEISFFFLT